MTRRSDRPLPEEEQKQVWADYQGINQTPGVTSVPPLGPAEYATTVRGVDPPHRGSRTAGPPASGTGTRERASLAIGYLVGGGIMIIGGVVEALLGIDAEGKSLEAIAPPLTKVASS